MSWDTLIKTYLLARLTLSEIRSKNFALFIGIDKGGGSGVVKVVLGMVFNETDHMTDHGVYETNSDKNFFPLALFRSDENRDLFKAVLGM